VPETDAIDLSTMPRPRRSSARRRPDIDAVIVATISNPKQTRRSRRSSPTAGANPPPPTTSTPRARLRVRGRAGRRPHPCGAAHYASSSAPRSSATSSTHRSAHLVPPRRRRGRRGDRPERHPGISATVGLGRLEGRCRRHEPHPHEFRDGVAPWPTLRQEGPTVFRWAVWEMVKVARRPSRPPASRHPTSPRSCPTRPTCASSTSSRSS
jgi:3-oxoacyl-[acyl-carrier-protein] synthase-3